MLGVVFIVAADEMVLVLVGGNQFFLRRAFTREGFSGVSYPVAGFGCADSLLPVAPLSTWLP